MIETFILYLAKPIHFSPEISGLQCRLVDEHTLEVDVHKDQPMNEVFHLLSEHAIEVASMKNKANRLETLFLDMIQQNNGLNDATE